MNVKNICISSTFLCFCPLNLSFKLTFNISKKAYSWISHDVTAAMLVSRSNPPGIECYCYANVFFCFR